MFDFWFIEHLAKQIGKKIDFKPVDKIYINRFWCRESAAAASEAVYFCLNQNVHPEHGLRELSLQTLDRNLSLDDRTLERLFKVCRHVQKLQI